MLGCCSFWFLLIVLLYAFISGGLVMFHNPTPTLTPEMSQLNTSDYQLGDSPLGTAWFIQASDLHLGRTNGVANSFKLALFCCLTLPYPHVLRWFVAEVVNGLVKPHRFVITGDMVDNMNAFVCFCSSFNYFSSSQTCNCPIKSWLGNIL